MTRRPPSPGRVAAVLAALQAGTPAAEVAARYGLALRTVYRWRDRFTESTDTVQDRLRVLRAQRDSIDKDIRRLQKLLAPPKTNPEAQHALERERYAARKREGRCPRCNAVLQPSEQGAYVYCGDCRERLYAAEQRRRARSS